MHNRPTAAKRLNLRRAVIQSVSTLCTCTVLHSTLQYCEQTPDFNGDESHQAAGSDGLTDLSAVARRLKKTRLCVLSYLKHPCILAYGCHGNQPIGSCCFLGCVIKWCGSICHSLDRCVVYSSEAKPVKLCGLFHRDSMLASPHPPHPRGLCDSLVVIQAKRMWQEEVRHIPPT